MYPRLILKHLIYLIILTEFTIAHFLCYNSPSSVKNFVWSPKRDRRFLKRSFSYRGAMAFNQLSNELQSL